jgi:cyclopropane-fatty-acyl-phospholipid synthase
MEQQPLVVSNESPLYIPAKTSRFERFGQRLLLQQLEQLQGGEVRLTYDGITQVFGKADRNDPLSVGVEVLNPNFFAEAAFGGSVGVGAAYMQNMWRCTDLTALLRIFVRHRDALSRLDGPWMTLNSVMLRLLHFFNDNTRAGSARNIAAHYDIGNDLYELMLDETMAYSCGIYPRSDSSLRDAQTAKFDAVCQKLALTPQDHLLEIGTGWGGLAIHAVRHYGCRVTTTTISREQFSYTAALIKKLQLNDRITLLMQDYRDLSGQFDKLVSIEMIEAVGQRHLNTYAKTCSRLLKPNGAFLLQAITIRDQIYEQALHAVDFIQRFIFPGSFIPSIQALSKAFTQATDLKIAQLTDIGPHYARTLHDWRERFFRNLAGVRRLGYPESFIRMWEFYLCYCEAGFAERQLGDVQILWVKPGWMHS